MNSLTSQYIRPEDLSPLPATLDAKKSPLALLAQTCSNIGADLLPNNKPIIPPLEKPKKSGHNSTGRDSVSSDKSSDNRSSFSIGINDSNPANNRSTSSSSTSSSSSATTSAAITFKPYESSVRTDTDANDKRSRSADGSSSVVRKSSPSTSWPSNGGRDISPVSLSSSAINHHNHHHHVHHLNGSSSDKRSDSESNSEKALSSKSTSSTTSTSESMASYAGFNPLDSLPHLSRDLMKQSNNLTPYPGLSPYFNHAAAAAALGHGQGLRSPMAGQVCRDPFCKCFQSGVGLSSCPSGCVQCLHRDPATTTSTTSSTSNSSMGLHHLAGHHGHQHGSAGGSASGPMNMGNYATDSLLPRSNVCSWTVGGIYCGKTFSTCEELLQHLKTHTNSDGLGSASSPTVITTPPGYFFSPLMSNGFRSRDPLVTGLSPHHRFHPYKAPIIPRNVSSLGANQMPASHFPSLTSQMAISSYYSPYNLY